MTVKAVLASQRAPSVAASEGAMRGGAADGQALGTERGVGVVCATPELSVQACLALMDAEGLSQIAVVDDGKALGLLGIAELQKALIAHYESIFTAIELDQRLLFMQGVYSC